MRLADLVHSAVLVILHLSVTSSAKDGLGFRILEILAGPAQKGPTPSTKTALLLCQRPGFENIDLELLRSTGVPNALMLSAHRDPKTWSNVIDNLVVSYPEHLVSVVLDLGCPNALGVLQKANATKMFRSPYRWLLIPPTSNETSMSLERCADLTEGFLGNLAIFLDSEVISMCLYGESGLIIEWYRLYLTELPFIGELGSWKSDTVDSRIRWTERSLQPMAVRRSNLRKLPLNVGFLLRFNESLQHLEDGYETRKDTMTKYFWPILHNTANMLNGTLVAKWSGSWGFPVNGTWTGMAGMQIRGEVDISGIPAVMEHVRNTVLSFVSFRGPSAGIFIFRAPPMSYEANLFALPFPDTLWAAAGGLISICILLLYLVLTAEDIMDKDRPPSATPVVAVATIQVPLGSAKPKQFLAPPAPTEEEIADNMVVPVVSQNAVVGGDGIQAKARLHGSWSDVMLLVFGAICQQGSPVEARTIPGRIVTISMLIGLIFLFTSYSASIVVLLQSTSNSIRTLDDLWKSRMPCGAEDVAYNKYFFKHAQGESRVGIYKKVLKKNKKSPSGNNFLSLESGMDRVRKDYFAFHALSTSIFPIISETWQEQEKCALREMNNMVYPQNPDISTSKHSPLLEVFRITLRKMHERGIRNREIRRVIPSKPVCTNPGSNFGSVSVMDCYFAIVILTTGLIASMLVLALEHLAFYRLRKAASEAAAAAEAAAQAAARIRGRLLTPKRILKD